MLTMKNVLVADDHELIIKGICDILNEKFSIDNVITFTNPEKILEAVKEQTFDLYILDLEFQEMSGFDLIEQIRKKYSNAKIIVVTMHEEIWNANRLFELDVNGIVLKKASSAYLAEAIEAVMDNKQFLCPKFEKLKERNIAYKKRKKSKDSQPSPSELVVLKYLAEGYTSKQIAKTLCVTEDTIEAHRKSLFVKLEARNAAHLASIAIRQRLIE